MMEIPPTFWIWTAVVLGMAVLFVRSKKWGGPKPLRHVFAERLDDKNQPEGEKSSFTLADGRLVLFVDWECPGEGPFTYRCRIYDGKKRQVHESAASMNPSNGSWSTWTWYDFDQQRDQPGNWRYEVTVDQIPVLSAAVVVNR